jgi:hypothetical protein
MVKRGEEQAVNVHPHGYLIKGREFFEDVVSLLVNGDGFIALAGTLRRRITVRFFIQPWPANLLRASTLASFLTHVGYGYGRSIF